MQFWSGDWAWGPRYLQIVVPCLAAMAAPLMNARGWRRALVAVSVLGFFFAAVPAVLVRFTLVFYAAFKVMPPPTTRPEGVGSQLLRAGLAHVALAADPVSAALASRALGNSLNHVTSPLGPAPVTAFLRGPKVPRVEFWWLRARDLGATAVLLFALFPIAAVVVGVRTLNGYLESA